MAEVKLRIIADDSSITGVFSKATSDYGKLGAASKKALDTQKDGFKQVAAAAEKANTEIASPEPKIALDKNVNSVKGLKEQIREYTNAAIKAGEQSPIGKEFLNKAAEAKDRLNDIQQSLGNLSKDTKVFSGLTEGATTAAAAFSVFQGVSALVGTENKDLQKVLVKLQASTAILSGLTQIQNALQKESAIRILISSVAQKASAIATNAYSAAMGVLTGSLSIATVATNVLTVATRVLLGPIGIVLAAIGLVAGAVALFSEEEGENTEKVLENVKALNELNAALQDIQNQIQDTRDERAVELGELTQHEADKRKLERDFVSESLKARNQLNEKLLELRKKFEDGELEDAADFLSQQTTLIQGAYAVQLKKNELFHEQGKTLSVKADKDDEKTAKEARDKAIAEQKKRNDELLRLRKDFISASLDLFKKANQAEAEGLTGRARADKQRDIAENELNDLRASLEEKGKLQDKNFKFSEQQLEQFAILEAAIARKHAEDLLKIEFDNQTARNELEQDLLIKDLNAFDISSVERKKKLIANGLSENQATEIIQKDRQAIINKFSIEELAQQETISLAKVDQLKRGAEKEEDFEKIKQEQKLKIQLAFAQRRLELLISQGEVENEVAIQQLKATIAKLQNELGSIGEEKNKFSFAKLLGIDQETLDGIIDIAKTTSDAISDILERRLAKEQEIVNRRKELNDEDIQNSNDRLNQLTDQLKIEEELAEKGFANNLDLVHAQIEEEKKARDGALDEQKAIQIKEAELQKKKERIDTLNQISSIITAAANVIAGFSTVPLVGSILGAIAVAAMIAGFIASKQKVKDAAKLEHGGKLKGKSHREGGMKIEGTDYEVEGEEWFINKKSSKKHDRILRAINEDNFKGLKPIDIAPLLKGTGVVLLEDAPNKINERTAIIRDSEATSFAHSITAEKRLASIEDKMTGYFNYQKMKPETKESGGKIIKKQGNVTIITKKK